MRAVALATLLAFVPTAGCSWIFMDKAPHSAPPEIDVDCSESQAAPITDVVFATLYTLATTGTVMNATGSSSTSSSGGDSQPVAPFIVSGLLMVGLFSLSAYSGFKSSRRCKRFHREHDEYEEGILDRAEQRDVRPALPDPQAGVKGHKCRPHRECDPGLECAQGMCLELQH
jgi:hypothetical protein